MTTGRKFTPSWRRAAPAALIAAVLLVLLLRGADFSRLEAALHALPSWLWIVAAGGLLGTYALRAWRMRLEWRDVDLASWPACLRLVLAHNAALALLPLRSGEAGYVLLVHRLWGVPAAEAARSLLWLRLQDAFVLLLLAALLLAPMPWPWRLALTVTTAFGAWLLLPALLRQARGQSARIDRWAGALLRGRSDAAGWLLCTANWVLKIGAIAALLHALVAIDVLSAWRGALGGELAAALPLQAPAGLGTYEAGVWTAIHLFAAAPANLAAAALAVHLFALLVLLAATLALHAGRLADRTTPMGTL